MRPRNVIAIALPLVGMALPMAAWAASPGPPPPPPPPPPAGPVYTGVGSFESRLVTVQDDLIVRLYEQSLHARFPDPKDAITIRHSLTTPTVHGEQPAYGLATFDTGEFAGRWQFLSPEGGLPTRAWRDVDRSGAHGFQAERIGYCSGEAGACERWFDTGRHRTPRPSFDAGERAAAEWKNRVMQEPCERVPSHMPSLAPLQRAVAAAELPTTKVALLLLQNPCGEVRDAMIHSGSGNRGVDRALLQWAKRVILPQDGGGTKVEGGYGLLPIVLSSE